MRKAVDKKDKWTYITSNLCKMFHEGITNFSNLLDKIEKIFEKLDASIIVKEVGYEISSSVVNKLAMREPML